MDSDVLLGIPLYNPLRILGGSVNRNGVRSTMNAADESSEAIGLVPMLVN